MRNCTRGWSAVATILQRHTPRLDVLQPCFLALKCDKGFYAGMSCLSTAVSCTFLRQSKFQQAPCHLHTPITLKPLASGLGATYPGYVSIASINSFGGCDPAQLAHCCHSFDQQSTVVSETDHSPVSNVALFRSSWRASRSSHSKVANTPEYQPWVQSRAVPGQGPGRDPELASEAC